MPDQQYKVILNLPFMIEMTKLTNTGNFIADAVRTSDNFTIQFGSESLVDISKQLIKKIGFGNDGNLLKDYKEYLKDKNKILTSEQEGLLIFALAEANNDSDGSVSKRLDEFKKNSKSMKGEKELYQDFLTFLKEYFSVIVREESLKDNMKDGALNRIYVYAKKYEKQEEAIEEILLQKWVSLWTDNCLAEKSIEASCSASRLASSYDENPTAAKRELFKSIATQGFQAFEHAALAYAMMTPKNTDEGLMVTVGYSNFSLEFSPNASDKEMNIRTTREDYALSYNIDGDSKIRFLQKNGEFKDVNEPKAKDYFNKNKKNLMPILSAQSEMSSKDALSTKLENITITLHTPKIKLNPDVVKSLNEGAVLFSLGLGEKQSGQQRSGTPDSYDSGINPHI